MLRGSLKYSKGNTNTGAYSWVHKLPEAQQASVQDPLSFTSNGGVLSICSLRNKLAEIKCFIKGQSKYFMDSVHQISGWRQGGILSSLSGLHPTSFMVPDTVISTHPAFIHQSLRSRLLVSGSNCSTRFLLDPIKQATETFTTLYNWGKNGSGSALP